MHNSTPTPSPRPSLDQNIEAKQESQHAKINRKHKTNERKHNSESSGSTDKENKSSSCSAEDEEKKHNKHKERHHSRSSDRKHRDNSHSTRERRHKSRSHRDHSKSSSLANEKRENEPIYAEISDQYILPPISNTPGVEGLRHRNTQLPSTPPRNGTPSQSPDGASTPNSKESSPPSYKSNKDRKDSRDSDVIYSSSWPGTTKDYKKTIMNSLSKFKTKLAYPVQQRAFIIPSIAFITFVASYSILMPKYYANIQNLTKDPLLSIPIIIASVLFVTSMIAFISNLKDTRIKITNTKDDHEVFKQLKSLRNEKCIRSIELDLSNNTHYTLLDGKKYETLAFKKLALTLNRPLICAEMAAFVTLTSTYLLTKYFEIGYKNLADSLLTFNTNNAELIGFTAATGVILALFICSFVHYYRKECVEGLELRKCPREIASFNEEYIREAEAHYNSKKTLSSGKHSEGKAASLTINQAVVEYYNDKTVIVTS